MRALAQLALVRSESERQSYLRGFGAHRHDGQGKLDSFVRWANTDPRIEHVPALFAELERTDADYHGALTSEATTLVYLRGEGKTPAQRVRDYLGLLGIESSEQVIEAFGRLLPPGTSRETVVATVRLMRRRWLEIYGNDPFFAED